MTDDKHPGEWTARLTGVLPAAVLLLVLYLSWRIVLPFLPALCWAFALAVIGQPVYAWLLRTGMPRAAAALAIVILVVLILFGPGALLAGALAREARDVVAGLTRNGLVLPKTGAVARLIAWLDAQYDLPAEAARLAGAAAGMASGAVTRVVAGSVWALSQVAAALFVLFYFLRDGEAILFKLRSAIPLPDDEVERMWLRISQTLRVSLGAKLLMGTLQGTLGGVILPGWACPRRCSGAS